MDPKQLVADIRKFTAITKVSVEDQHMNVRNSHIAAQREATEKLVGLRREYASHLKESVTVVFVRATNWPVQESFCSELRKQGLHNAVLFDAGAFWDYLAKPIDESLGGGREFGVGALRLLMNLFQHKADEVGYKYTKSLTQTTMPFIGDYKTLKNHIRAVITSCYGDEPYRKALEHEVLESCIQHGVPSGQVVLFVVGSQPEDDAPILASYPQQHAQLDLPDEPAVAPEFVTDTMKNIIKSKKKAQ